MGLVADNIANIFSLFSFASKKRELNKIKDFLYNDTAKKDYTWIKYELKMTFVGIAFYVSMLFALFVFMIHLRKIEAITTGDFVVDNIWKLVSEVGEFASKMGDFKSSFAILQIDNNAFDAKNSKVLAVKNGEMIFDNIDFGYSKNNLIFNNLSIKIKAGQKVGLVGYSGAGKSTLISLLLKNFKVNSGDILIDGQSIYDVSCDSLRSSIALIIALIVARYNAFSSLHCRKYWLCQRRSNSKRN